jgi:O-antigen/teichoic acid export membrane protein
VSGRKLGVASATLLAATAVVNLSMVFYHSLLSRRLGTEYAQLVALMAVSNVLGNITLGLSTSLVKAFSADAELKGPGAVLGRLRSLVLPGGLTLLGATLALLLASPAVAAYLKLPSALLAAMVMLMFANGVLLLVLRAALQGLHHFGWLGLSLMGEGLARVGGALAFSARGAAGGLGAMVLGQAGGIVGAVGGLMGLGQALPPLKRADGVHGWRKAMHEAGSDTLVLTLFAVMAFLDVVVLKHYYDDGRASLYSRAAMVAKSFLYLAGALNLVVLPTPPARSG